jgi:hypothetical protein
MSLEFLLSKKSALKAEPKRNYVEENKVQLSVSADALKNKSYNTFDVSKKPNEKK